MRTLAYVVASLLLLLAVPAWAKPTHFVGAHPVAASYGGGYCYIDVPHVHIYNPDRAPLYQQTPDGVVFTGDPTPFGYEGDRNVFYGHHPVPGVVVNNEPVYCFINGPHYHPYEPADGPEYRIKNGVAFYVGPFAPSYARLKPGRVKVVNAEYRPFVSFRPTVEVEPPPEYHGDVVVVGAPPPAPGVVVTAPAPPSVVVTAPPPPRVVVGAPPPVVVVGAPPPVIVGAPPPVIVREPDYGHGRGHAYGHYKHGHGYFKHGR
ncbi:MAG TPA: hypothetical protein VH877_28525 [Polyangia bacterium]|jgi:hypothetical protein|nr:hypothetical protein [Polyangia bacterium]